MKALANIILIALLCTNVAAFQRKSRQLLLEAQLVNTGMVTPTGKHLYLRVYDNGEFEYEDEVIKRGTPHYLIRQEKLDNAQLKNLVSFLSSLESQKLAPEYSPIRPPLDHSIELTISIWHMNQYQKLVVRNFSPTAAQSSDIYPSGLIDLLCRIERLRKRASFGITADASKWCVK